MSDHFISLLQEDIIYPYIFSKLSLKDYFNLRCLSKAYKELVDCYFQQLKTLDLSNYKNFSEDAFRILNLNCTHLTCIQLKSCPWITNELLIPLFKNNKNIVSLNLSHCENLTAACLQPVIVSCKELKDLDLSGNHWLTNGCLEALIFHHTNLCSLNLADCSQISDQSVIYNLLRKFTNLNQLDLSKNPSIDNQILAVVAESCSNMKNLKLVDCPNINPSSDVIRYLLENCHLENLTIINKNPRRFPT
ncbi:unnamed protein product [Bemisia tabaci]|uniref:F-box/LRR-repeat protein 15 n=1 Tax=Bemisia tabaci TaxID=7038 RepID=A0A9P0F8G9_BEMTA|nr:PREDICTED: F-box/LRR-repeat protein 15 [Bemisia tabaci]CAH0393691.1 unnamed protein product [Bemisia tabaci]